MTAGSFHTKNIFLGIASAFLIFLSAFSGSYIIMGIFYVGILCLAGKISWESTQHYPKEFWKWGFSFIGIPLGYALYIGFIQPNPLAFIGVWTAALLPIYAVSIIFGIISKKKYRNLNK